MPSQNIHVLTEVVSLEDLCNEVAKLQKVLRYLLDGNLDFENVRAKGIIAETIDVKELSAITARMGKLTSGEIYSAYIATREAVYPRVEMNSQSNFIEAAQDANRFLTISPFSGLAPVLQLFDGINSRSLLLYLLASGAVISAIGPLQISASGTVEILGSSVLINGTNFASKADKSSFTGTLYVSNTSGGPANRAINVVNGVIQ